MVENRCRMFHKKKILVVGSMFLTVLFLLIVRICYFAAVKGEYYAQKATELHERERDIKAARGRILDRNGKVLADNRQVCTVSVIHNQIEKPSEVVALLHKELGVPVETLEKRISKYTAMERIKSNVEKEVGDRIRAGHLKGIKVDEDYKRDYPYHELASKVLGFTGAENQGILGLEVSYEEILQGTPGTIYTMTDARGVEVEKEGERRQEPIAGKDLMITLDLNIQTYATQLALQAMKAKDAEAVSILVMNPQNGEIYCMVDVPEYDLENPFELSEEVLADARKRRLKERLAEAQQRGQQTDDQALRQALEEEVAQEQLTQEQLADARNRMWRNTCINDTYEPGSTFKIITASAGLEAGVITPASTFHCPGFIVVGDRRIRCHKVTGHGSQDFVHCMMNSCNPALISVGLRLGIEEYYRYFTQFGLLDRTGIDVPGEAGTIMHKKENMKDVELACVSFGQSFQITPIRLLTTVSSIINGGKRITPHFGKQVLNSDGEVEKVYAYPVTENIVSETTVDTIRNILEMVVKEGSGKNGSVPGFRIGGKTATSQTLPRSNGRYIASFLGFAPANDPQVIALAVIHNPQGMYYGGQVAAPVLRQLFENILPYLGIEEYNEEMDLNQ